MWVRESGIQIAFGRRLRERPIQSRGKQFLKGHPLPMHIFSKNCLLS